MPANWTAPKTWVLDELVDETDLNTHVRDNLLWLKVNPVVNEQIIAPGAANIAANWTTAAVLTTGSLALDADAGAFYVEAWGGFWVYSVGTGGYGWEYQIVEATAGTLSTVHWQGGGANTNGPWYMRTRDYAWGGTSRTVTLNLYTSNCEVRTGTSSVPGQPYSGTRPEFVLRVVRSY